MRNALPLPLFAALMTLVSIFGCDEGALDANDMDIESGADDSNDIIPDLPDEQAALFEIAVHNKPALLNVDTFVSGTVPRYYEFNNANTENPNGYYWCGHAALKSVGKYITGNTKSLSSLHNTFYQNSANYRADNYCPINSGQHWCAKLQDLMWAAQLAQNSGYGRGNSVVRNITRANNGVVNYVGFFDQVKGGANAGYPAIVPSNWKYAVGHFWIIVGYKDTGTATTSTLYVRDVALSEAAIPVSKYDWAVNVKTFVDATQVGSANISMLYVK